MAYVPKWRHSLRPLEPSFLDVYTDADNEASSARPTGAAPLIRPTAPGIYEKPLSEIAKLTPKRTRTTPSLSSADKRLQDWEEKKRQFVQKQRRADLTMRKTLSEHHRSAKYQVPPTRTDQLEQQVLQQTQQHIQQQLQPTIVGPASSTTRTRALGVESPPASPQVTALPSMQPPPHQSVPPIQLERAQAPSPSTPRNMTNGPYNRSTTTEAAQQQL